MDKCERCFHDFSNLVTKVAGYFDMYKEDLEIADLEKLGQAIDELVKFAKDKTKFIQL